MDNNEIGKRLKKIRIDHGLSQDELGRSLNLSRTAIGNWERGERSINLQDLNNLAAFFGIPVQYFLGGDEQEKLPKSEVNHVIRVVHIDPFPSILDYILVGVLVISLFAFIFLSKDDPIKSAAYFLIIGIVIGSIFLIKHIFNFLKNTKSVAFPSTQQAIFQTRKQGENSLNTWIHVIYVFTITVTFLMLNIYIINVLDDETYAIITLLNYIILGICMGVLSFKNVVKSRKPEFLYYPTNRYFDLWIYDFVLAVTYVQVIFSFTIMIGYGDYQQYPTLFWVCLSLLFASLLMVNILVIEQRRIFNSYKVIIK
jgi:transcriptional regulator with XRE-family HTH domain